MPNAKSARGAVSRHTHPQRSPLKRFYVAALLFLLPMLMAIFNLFSKKVRNETAYLGEGFTLTLAVTGWNRKKTLKHGAHSWHASAQAAPQLTIEFHDLDYAFDVFTGNITLQDALAARYFSTRGPNDKGVATTYLFTVILKAFFGWRKSYRS